jgi:hypothetical protein
MPYEVKDRFKRKVIMGDKFDTNELLQEYEKRAEELNDEDYKKVEATGVDVKDIKTLLMVFQDFWLKAILNHPTIGRTIQEKDR